MQRVLRFDPPDGARIIATKQSLTIELHVAPPVPPHHTATLVIEPASGPPLKLVSSSHGRRLRFEWPMPAPGGDYLLRLETDDGSWLGTARLTLDLVAPLAPEIATDPCALTLSPDARLAAGTVECPPDEFPRPPLLAVDAAGCVHAAWSVNAEGWVLVPRSDTRVDLLRSTRGGLIAKLEAAEVRDAIFWGDAIAVLTPAEVLLFGREGSPPAASFASVKDAVALAVSDAGHLIVVQQGPSENVRIFRPDGSELSPPGAFFGRGWYAQQRNTALIHDEESCRYLLMPSAEGCCAASPRELSREEALFFALIDDLHDLRLRVFYPEVGTVILGPSAEEDALDAGRPSTAWHRVLLFGEIPEGSVVELSTRASDDLIAVDPLIPSGWSRAVEASTESRGEVESPADVRQAAMDALVLAKPGRFLALRLTLRGNGRQTPRITRIEVERPREGISRYLPRFFRESTPDDDFLRRWLALFETTAFSGVRARFDAYPELFDPRTAPEPMLPYLAEWLQVPVLDRFREEPGLFRHVLIQAPELARTRGTPAGIELAVRLYLGFHVHVREDFAVRSDFVLDGAVLGLHTVLTSEPGPTDLGDARLGCTFLNECEERSGHRTSHFDVLVPARFVCDSKTLELLRQIIELEKPAHTTFRILPTAAAGFVVGTASVVGQDTSADFDRTQRDPASYGVVLSNGPGRPAPLGLGFALGRDSRLYVPPGSPSFQITGAGLTVGRTTRIGAAARHEESSCPPAR